MANESCRVLVLAGEDKLPGQPLWDYLRGTNPTQIEVRAGTGLPPDLDHYQVLVLVEPARLSAAEQERLATFVRDGGGCLAW